MKAQEKRQYQINDLQAIDKAFEEYRSVLYQLPTGGGKSVIATNFIAERKDKNILILAHKRRLLTQMGEHLKNIGVTRSGLLVSGKAENMDANIVVVSIRSAVKDARLEALLEKEWDYVIIDEARHSRTGSYDKVLDQLKEAHPNCRILGLDATPYRKDRKRLDKHFQYMVVSEENVATLTAKGYLQACKVIQTPIDKEALKEQVKEVANDYQQQALSDYMRQEKYLDYVVSNYTENGEGRQAVVFAVDKSHAKDLQAKFAAAGYKVGQIDSDMSVDEVEKAFKAFETKAIQILINIEMATEGVDLPNCGCIIGARPTKSLTLYLQMGGRGTRPDGEFSYFILLDCCGWTEEFGTLASPKHWSLNPEIDPNNPRKKNKIVGRRANGELVEDITDFMGEIIELTPEEYIKQLSGGLESAKKANLSIDDKIKELLEALVQLFTLLMKKEANEFVFKSVLDRYDSSKVQIRFATKNHTIEEDWDYIYYGEIVLGEKQIYAKLSEAGGYYTKKQPITEYMRLSKGVSLLNQTFLEEKDAEKLRGKATDLLEQVSDLSKSKIDLNEFREAAKKAKREQWEKKVEDHAKLEGCFEFVGTSIDTSDYFKDGSYSWKIIGIKIPNKQINKHHNTIIVVTQHYDRWKSQLTGEPREEEKKYIKGERVLQIIEDAKWGEIQES